jgi:hypothetical protein
MLWRWLVVVIITFTLGILQQAICLQSHLPIISRRNPDSSWSLLHATTTESPFQIRGKVNEIDFCMAPSDVTLSRSYASPAYGVPQTATRMISLTRALNSASNRALRRILLSRSWPSAEALNMSLRLILASSSSSSLDVDPENYGRNFELAIKETSQLDSSPKCPVPRPILNILMRRSKGIADSPLRLRSSKDGSSKRTDEEWIADQIASFRTTYNAVPGYSKAEDYLECILSLATSGVESPKKSNVFSGGVYDEPYKRFISVLQSAGVQFVPQAEDSIINNEPRQKSQLRTIARKLIDQDICLSILDKIEMDRERCLFHESREQRDYKASKDVMESNTTYSGETPSNQENEASAANQIQKSALVSTERSKNTEEKGRKFIFSFWKKRKPLIQKKEIGTTVDSEVQLVSNSNQETVSIIENDDLGGVLLSSKEPSMTRQLNVLSNVVQRTLLFGGFQELLVLYETLEADKPAFVRRWYPRNCTIEQYLEDTVVDDPLHETRSGVQYFNCLLQLLKVCYSKGPITDLNPPFPLGQSYSNAFERLTASLVELGSGYVRPVSSLGVSRTRGMQTLPKNAKEELGRFAEWERQFRQSSQRREFNSYPNDLVGRWLVKDEVQGKTIGVSTVTFRAEGKVDVEQPLQGLRWRLDPGPTHLDTCTFQVLGEDGAILQYKGFVDRGARLEARFSGRPITIRGEVRFQMRDSELAFLGDDYRKDMLPLLSSTGRTRFIMLSEK